MIEPVTLALPPEIEEYKRRIKASLRWHTRFVHGFSFPYHQQVWSEALEDESIKRLLIVAAPKFGKSPVVGIDYLGWRIGKDPDGYHCIYVSNTATQANKQSIALRDTIAYNENYRFLYDVRPNPGKGWSEHEWYVQRKNEADKDPTLQATGVGGPILGATVQELVLDDVADQENMATEYQRQKLMDWLGLTAFSRLVPGGRVIMICTRWHESDPAAIFEREGWTVIHTPAIDDNGEATYPQFWPVEALIGPGPGSALSAMGSMRQFELVYQGHVMPAEGNIFKHEWWRYWKNGSAPWQYDVHHPDYMAIHGTVQIYDTAFKEKQDNDFSVCETWGIVDNGYYLLDLWRGKVDYPKLKALAINNWEQWKPLAVLIEDAASGQSLIQDLKAKTRIPVIAVKADRDKVSRANAVTATVAAGKVFLPEDASWRLQWEHEHEVFPGGANDDQVDCTVHFLNWVRDHISTAAPPPTEVKKTSPWPR